MRICVKRNYAVSLATALVAVAGTSLCTAGSAQTIYKITDENGHVTYSDVVPESGNHTVEEYGVKAPNTAVPLQPASPATSAMGNPTVDAISYHTAINQPPNGATVPMGPGNFTVAAETSPPLGASEHLQLEVDGSAFGAPRKEATWKLENIFRGEHKLRVIRLDETGDMVDASETSTVFVLRPSVIK